jgi:putative selenate reductase
MGDYCNECGNCATFCPTSGAPYQDKAKFHLSAESFASARIGYYFSEDSRLVYKDDERRADLEIAADGYIYENEAMRVNLDNDYEARKVELKGNGNAAVNLRHAVEMAILAQAARQVLPLALRNIED